MQKKFDEKNISEKEMSELKYNLEKELNEKIDPKTWDKCAKTVLSIYENIDSTSIVKLNEKIFCDQTKKSRIVDIALHSNIGMHKILLIIKLLPIKESIDVRFVEDFVQTIRDIQASKGVIVGIGDFTQEAVEYAKNNMIDLCTLTDAQIKNWSESIALPIIWTHTYILLDVELREIIYRRGSTFFADPLKWIYSNDNGKTTFTILSFFMDKWNRNEIPHLTDSIFIIPSNLDNLKVRTNQNEWAKLADFKIYYKAQEEYFFKYLNSKNYTFYKDYISEDTLYFHLTTEAFLLKKDSTWIKIEKENLNRLNKGFVTLFINTMTNLNSFVSIKPHFLKEVKSSKLILD
jgi:hypothetical protein